MTTKTLEAGTRIKVRGISVFGPLVVWEQATIASRPRSTEEPPEGHAFVRFDRDGWCRYVHENDIQITVRISSDDRV